MSVICKIKIIIQLLAFRLNLIISFSYLQLFIHVEYIYRYLPYVKLKNIVTGLLIYSVIKLVFIITITTKYAFDSRIRI